MADTYTVKNGDTLWSIAKDHLGAGSRYQELAKLNNIANPNYIRIGQVLRLNKTASTPTVTHNANAKKVTIKQFGLVSNAENTLFVEWEWTRDKTENYKYKWYYDTGDGLWFVSEESTTTYKYTTCSIPSNAKRVCVRIKPIAKKFTKDNKETYHWTDSVWTEAKEAIFNVASSMPPATPPVPDVSDSTKYQLIAKLDANSLDLSAINAPTHIKFRIVKNNTSTYNIGQAKINKGYEYVSYACNLDAGHTYRVQCKGVRGNLESDGWSDYSDKVTTPPVAPGGFTICKPESETSVYLEWKNVNGATEYQIEHTDDKKYFDKSSDIPPTSVTASTGKTTGIFINGLTSGKEYFFRIRSVDTEASGDGASPWSKISSAIIGSTPSMPTTWSSTATVIAGEPLTLYWIHNPVDGSSQTKAEVRIYMTNLNGLSISDVLGDNDAFGTIENVVVNANFVTFNIKNKTNKDERDKTSWLKIDTSKFNEGANLEWSIRTKGITADYSDYSMSRTVDIYAPPTLELKVTDKNANEIETITSFPLYISALMGSGTTQKPIAYHVTIVANDSYESVDDLGNAKLINKGEQIYAKYFDIPEVFESSEPLVVNLSAGDMDLENGVSYSVTGIVSMDSGLTAESTTEFYISWTDEEFTPNAEVGIDDETLVAHIRPYCMDYKTSIREVSLTSGKYTVTSNVIDETTISEVYTTTDEEVFMGIINNAQIYYCIVYTDGNGNPIDPICYVVMRNSNVFTKTNSRINQSVISSVYTDTGENDEFPRSEVLLGIRNSNVINYAVVDESELVEDVMLSVYRREFDGGFTELATDINNMSNTFITDPHPALDYARYRIVARSEITGAISYYDLPGIPVGGKSIVIQWDEDWSTFDNPEADILAEPAWAGSMLKLHYNIDVSDSNQADVELVEYVGRSHPVGYYGTQVGHTSTWNVDIEKSDEETLYTLRRLSRWMGDVYVREPSGSGYWANVSVSFSQKHLELTIPVTINVTRVEGGA